MHIVHISSVHNAHDPRIRHKQLQSIASRGWRATFITGDLQAEDGEGIGVKRVSPGNNRRWLRILYTAPLAMLYASRENGDIYHIHDPELLPWALILRLKGRPVVYDIHEDYCSSVMQKHYLPRFLRPLAGTVTKLAEHLLARPCNKVIAEEYYQKRFPEAVAVRNYPHSSLLDCGQAFKADSRWLLYTGNVFESRGALTMARLLRARSEYSLIAAGFCPKNVARAMRLEAGTAAENFHLPGWGRYVPFQEIVQTYSAGGWLAGLALFPDCEHYREKELTKFFEYMAVGLPVVASDFPAWRELIHKQGVGLCVNPEDPQETAKALDWLRANPDKACAMGQKGRKLVAENYNWETQRQRLLEFYQQIAGARSVTSPYQTL